LSVRLELISDDPHLGVGKQYRYADLERTLVHFGKRLDFDRHRKGFASVGPIAITTPAIGRHHCIDTFVQTCCGDRTGDRPHNVGARRPSRRRPSHHSAFPGEPRGPKRQ